jgi:CMP-N,N'-diacetyllegionaminic acid synthase
MIKNKKILAIVPARGGSKGIKNKNLKKIGKRSLVEITANILKKVKNIDCAMISTDSIKIAKEAQKFGLKFFKKRPSYLSDDRIGDAPVLKEALISAEKNMKTKFNIILMIQVTSPLRNVKNINDSIKKIINKKFDAVWTITKIEKKYNYLKQLKIKNDRLSLCNKNGFKIVARQELDDTFIRNGAVYTFSRNTVMKKNLIPKKTSYILLKSKQISIDNKTDLKLARTLLI